MSLKQILSDRGIVDTYRFSSVSSNWVVALKEAESKGVAAIPVRVGSKRVVLAADASQSRRSLPLLTWSTVSIASIMAFVFLGQSHPVKQAPVRVAHCLPITIGEKVQGLGQSRTLRDWKVTFDALSELGGMQKVQVTAECDSIRFVGKATIAKTADGMLIKKLAPID